LEKDQYDIIAKGFKDFNKFVSDLSFDESQAALAAAEVAYLTKILLGEESSLEKYNDSIDMLNWRIDSADYKPLGEYKYSNPEAFFYWYKANQQIKL